MHHRDEDEPESEERPERRVRLGRVDRRLEVLGKVVHGRQLVDGDVVLVNGARAEASNDISNYVIL